MYPFLAMQFIPICSVFASLAFIVAARSPLSYAPIPAGVYIPPKDANTTTILDLLKSRDDCSTLVSYIENSAGFAQAFDTPSTWGFTFFAPSNTAFENTGAYFSTYYATPKGKYWFGNILQHHYVPKSALPLSSFNSTVQRMMTGQYLFVSVQEVNGNIVLNSRAKVTQGDLGVNAGKGVVHVIDRVLDPSSMIFEGDIAQVKQSFIAGSCADPNLPYC